MLRMEACLKTSESGILSCHWICKNLRRQLVWSDELFGVSTVHSPGLRGLQQGGENHSMADLQLSDGIKSSAFPYILSQSSKASTGFGNPVIDFAINVDFYSECAAQVGEKVHCL